MYTMSRLHTNLYNLNALNCAFDTKSGDLHMLYDDIGFTMSITNFTHTATPTMSLTSTPTTVISSTVVPPSYCKY